MIDDEEQEKKKHKSLERQAHFVLEEARMVLPGVQALFGFQLIAVFNQRFDQRLSHEEQVLHLVALVLVALCATLLIAPAAYHRQVQPLAITTRFLEVATKLLAASMVPLVGAVAIDTYLIARLVLESRPIALMLAMALAAVMSAVWFAWPRYVRRRREDARRSFKGAAGSAGTAEQGTTLAPTSHS